MAYPKLEFFRFSLKHKDEMPRTFREFICMHIVYIPHLSCLGKMNYVQNNVMSFFSSCCLFLSIRQRG